MKCPMCFSPWISEQNLIHRFDCGSTYCSDFVPQYDICKECYRRRVDRLTQDNRILSDRIKELTPIP